MMAMDRQAEGKARIVGFRGAVGLIVSAAVALALTGAAPSASASPAAQLVVVTFPAKSGGGLGFELFPSEKAPAPARFVIYLPAGYSVNTSVAPGTKVGLFDALYYTKTDPFDFADVALRTGDPATLPGDPAAQACAPGPHAAFWTATFKVGKSPVTIRFYVDPTTGAETSLGAFKLVSCLASPYILVAQGGAPGGLQYDIFAVGLSGSVVSNPASGNFLWRTVVTPYNAGTGTSNVAGTFEARTHVLIPYVLTAHARYLRKTKTVVVTGKLSAVGQPRAGIRVGVLAGKIFPSNWGKVRTHADGSYSLRRRVRPGPSARTLLIDVFFAGSIQGACVDPPVAPAGCVDENTSPPIDATTKVRIPKRLKK
jgi:hypothetical protein